MLGILNINDLTKKKSFLGKTIHVEVESHTWFLPTSKREYNSKRKMRRETEPTRKRKEIDYKDKILF